MTAVTTWVDRDSYGPTPTVGSYPVAANEEIIRGCFVAIDSAGRAVDYSDDGNGYCIAGVARDSVDNRTTAPSGGGAGAEYADVDFGVYDFAYTDSAPKPRDIVYAVDNNTVSLTSTSAVSGYRGVAGIVIQTDTATTTCRVFVSPWNQSTLAYSAAVVVAQQAIDAIEVDLNSAADEVVVDLGSLRLNTGAGIAAFANGSADGFSLVSSECVGIRWNDDGTAVVMGETHIPTCWDDTAGVTLHLEGFRVGSADTTMTLTVGAFAVSPGQAHNADDDAGGSSTAFDGATNVITDETLAFAAGVLPAGSKVSFTITPSAALDADDFVLTGIRFVGTRKARLA